MRSRNAALVAYAFIAPWLVALVTFIGYPFLASLYFSLCDYAPLKTPLFVGLANYAELGRDVVFLRSMTTTVIFAAVALPLGVVLAVVLSLFLSANVGGQSFYRAAYYLPHLIPSVVVAILWMWMFNPQFGILNVALAPFGKVLSWLLTPFAAISLPVPGWALLIAVLATFALWRYLSLRAKGAAAAHSRMLRGAAHGALVCFVGSALAAACVWITPTDLEKVKSPGWLTDANPFPSNLSVAPSWALWALIYMSMWNVGQMAVIYLAKLQDIPAELYEAAELDGASYLEKTWNITIPMLSPVILFNVIMGIIGVFQIFTEPYIMTGGGPEDKTRFVAMFIYDQAFLYQRLGYGSAVAWVLFLVIAGLTLLALRISRGHVFYAGR